MRIGGQIDYGNPVSDHPLNRNRVLWLYGLPQWSGGGTWYDLCKKANGTLTGSPTWVPTQQYGAGVRGGSAGQYVTVPHQAGLVNRSGFAVGVTFYTDTTAGSNYEVIAYKGTDVVTAGSYLFRLILSATTLYNGVCTVSEIFSSTTITRGRVYRVLSVCDGSNETTYLNGVQAMTTAAVGPYLNESNAVFLGGGTGGSAAPLKGWVADFTVYDLTKGGLNGLSLATFDFDQARRGNPDLIRRTRTRYFLPNSTAPASPTSNLLLLGVG